jgi:hypothetical protein
VRTAADATSSGAEQNVARRRYHRGSFHQKAVSLNVIETKHRQLILTIGIDFECEWWRASHGVPEVSNYSKLTSRRQDGVAYGKKCEKSREPLNIVC